MYTLKDISVIIPTYYRADDLKKTLDALGPFVKKICQIIVVDQSKNDETKKIVGSYQKKHKNILYVFSNLPSITIARNLGVKHLYKKARLVCFIDDDVSVEKNYFEEILRVFNEYIEAKAAAGYVPSPKLAEMPLLEVFLRKMFFLSFGEKNKARIISTYGNTYPYQLTKTIRAQWMPGVNMVYKREIFKKQQFDEHLLGYTVAEDIDFSYRLFSKYPDSVFITPLASLIHRVSNVERVPTARMSYINQVDHFYFQLKNLRSWKQKMIFGWSLFGITLLRGMKVLARRKRDDFLKFKYFLISLGYCLNNIKIIARGRVREFPQE